MARLLTPYAASGNPIKSAIRNLESACLTWTRFAVSLDLPTQTTLSRIDAQTNVRVADAAVFALLAIAGLLCFQHVLSFGYLPWDDYESIARNPNLQGNLRRGLVNIWAHPYDGLYIPVAYTSWWFERLLNLSPAFSHAMNVILHVVTSCCVYLLAKLVIQNGPMSRVAASGAALFFLLHPLQVEAVAWATGRKDLLAGLFAAAGAVAYIRFHQCDKLPCYISALFFFGCSLLSKPSAVMFPVVILLLDRTTFSRRALRALPFFGLSLVSSALSIWAQSGPSGSVRSSVAIAWQTRPLIMLQAIDHYAAKLAAPIHLSPVYDKPEYILFGCAGVMLLCALAVMRHMKLLGAPSWHGAVTFIAGFVLLLPVSGIIPMHYQDISLTADRYLYVPMLALSVGVGYLLFQVLSFPRLRYVGAAAALVALVVLGNAARAQTLCWRDSLSLWSRAVQVAPNSAVAHNNLGMSLGEANRPGDAAHEFEAAIKLDPDYASAHLNLGNILLQTKDLPAALPHLETAARLDPAFWQTSSVLAGMYFEQQRTADAERAARTALMHNPNDLTSLAVLASVLGNSGKVREALSLLRDAAARNPHDAKIKELLRQAEQVSGQAAR
jgi:Flp pilus assembly protein TadD